MITKHNAQEINSADFETFVTKSDVPVLVDWWAHWCGPCRMLTTTMDQLANEYHGRARVVKINCDMHIEFARSNSIQALPTVTLWHGGKEVERITGLHNIARYRQTLDQLINAPKEGYP